MFSAHEKSELLSSQEIIGTSENSEEMGSFGRFRALARGYAFSVCLVAGDAGFGNGFQADGGAACWRLNET